MPNLWIGIIGASAALGATLVMAHPNARPSTPDTLQGREDFIAQGLSKAAPIPMGPYMSITGASASDQMLAVTVTLSPTAPKIAMDDAFKYGLKLGTCKDPTLSDLIKLGGSIRYTFKIWDGSVLQPAVITPSDCRSS